MSGELMSQCPEYLLQFSGQMERFSDTPDIFDTCIYSYQLEN